MNIINFYGNNMYWQQRGELVYWKLENDFCKRINTINIFSNFLKYKYQDIEVINLEKLNKLKKIKLHNKDNKYLGIDKKTNRLIYYDKIEYRIVKEENYKCPVAFYLPYLDMNLLEWVSDSCDRERKYYSIAKIIEKNCNNKFSEMDLDTLSWIVEKYIQYLKGVKNDK